MTSQQTKKMLCIVCTMLLGVLFGRSSANASLDVNAISARGQVANSLAVATANRSVFLPLILKPGILIPTPTSTPTTPPSGCTSPASTGAEWSMLAANPQRTSWTPEEVRCDLSVAWYRPIEPYIPYKVQPIAANGKIYVSTARGLYAINATSGNVDWVYPTELPLGHSPTIATVNGRVVAYVGGYDHKIHAIDANTGQDIAGYTPYNAEAGFDTNPLIIIDSYTNNAPVIFAGNRDGYLYAFDATTGNLKWKYQSGGPITYSAAYKNGVLYFASNDMYDYALNASNGSLKWRSVKFPGQSFTSYWPVVYTNKATNKDYVVFDSGDNFRDPELNAPFDEKDKIYANLQADALPVTSSPVPGDWVANTVTMDASAITKYYQTYPNRRVVYILDASTGSELTFDSNGDGIAEYAPFSLSGVTHAGTKYPPVINGVDGVYYQQTAYDQMTGWINRGAAVGWKFGTRYLSKVTGGASPDTTASDEPTAYSSGGKLIYMSLCCDRMAAMFDVTIPYGQPNRGWQIFGYLGSNSLVPGYQKMYDNGNSTQYNNMDGWQIYSGKNQSHNGIYGKHSITQSPPIPYHGKVFMLKGNSLMAFSPTGSGTKTPLPLATIVTAQSSSTIPSTSQLQQHLEAEVQKIVNAGHLRPGYFPMGQTDQYGQGWYNDDRELGEIFDYFSNPADTVVTLVQALPYLSPTLQLHVKTYLQNNYGPGKPYDLTKIVHIGWNNGANRTWSDIPSEIWSLNVWDKDTNQYSSNDHPPLNLKAVPICPGGCGIYWQRFPPFNFYAAWKYAQVFGGAKAIFDSMSSQIEAPPSNYTTYFPRKPYFINSYAAGYNGYLQLQQLAGYVPSATVQGWFNQMLSLRVTNFDATFKDTYYWGTNGWFGPNESDYTQSLAIARNFMFLTPELGDYMSLNAKSGVQTALDEYNYVGPYWFVNGFDGAVNEATFQPLYNSPALFQAKAYILKQPYNELVKWLDVPAFSVGDLFYIQNLVAALSAGTTP